MKKVDKKSYKKVTRQDSGFKRVEHYFNNRISLLYGNQKEALKKISKNNDRTCELLVGETGEDYGVIVYKNELTSEYTSLSFPEAFEIKTLFVVNPYKNSGQGIATHLLNHLSRRAYALKAKSLFVTVSSKSPEALAFFLYHGFRVRTIKPNLYLEGQNEYFLFHTNLKNLLKSTRDILRSPALGKSTQHLEHPDSKNIEFTEKETHVINFLKTQEFPLKSFFNYYGFQLSQELMHESVCKFVDWVMKWQKKALAKRYVILFTNSLYADDQKNNLIGELIIGMTQDAERHLLGCIPCTSLPQVFWKQIFKSFKINGIRTIDIFCSRHIQEVLDAASSCYPSMKLEKLNYPKSWSPKGFSPYSLFCELSRDVQFSDSLLKDDLVLQEGYIARAP